MIRQLLNGELQIIDILTDAIDINNSIIALLACWILYLIIELSVRSYYKYALRKKRRRIPYFSNSFIKRVFLVGYDGYVTKLHIVIHSCVLLTLLSYSFIIILALILQWQIVAGIRFVLLMFCNFILIEGFEWYFLIKDI